MELYAIQYVAHTIIIQHQLWGEKQDQKVMRK